MYEHISQARNKFYAHAICAHRGQHFIGGGFFARFTRAAHCVFQPTGRNQEPDRRIHQYNTIHCRKSIGAKCRRSVNIPASAAFQLSGAFHGEFAYDGFCHRRADHRRLPVVVVANSPIVSQPTRVSARLWHFSSAKAVGGCGSTR